MNNETKQEFREDEVALIRHWDKARGEWITNVFPKIGGRLRMAHEQNETINIETEIYKYDENVAVVIGTCRTGKGCFKGIGMSSVARDQKIAPAILELAETRSIARALRFAGFGVEYCSAEEVSHLENGNGAQPKEGNASKPEPRKQIEHQAPVLPAPDNGNEKPEGISGKIETSFQPVDKSATVFRPLFKAVKTETAAQGNDNGKKQMSVKQFEYIRSMGKKFGYDLQSLSQKSIEIFNRELSYLTVAEASCFIENIHGGCLRSSNPAV